MSITKIAAPLIGLMLVALPVSAQSTDVAAQIQALLAQIQALQKQIMQLQGQAGSVMCVQLSQNLYPDATDASTGGQVGKLQQFLARDAAIYPEGSVTGYFGPATERAVQRWQAKYGIVTSGTPDTTGYGFVGPKTREAMARGCEISSPLPTTPQSSTYASIEAVMKSGADSVLAKYFNIPSEAQIWIVDASTGLPYTGQSTYLKNGGTGSASISIPKDLPRGTYLLRVTSYGDQSKSYAQSLSFRVGTVSTTAYTPTNPVRISSFTADPISVVIGEPVTFSWKSNVTKDDVSKNGGGCSIEGRLLDRNQTFQVTTSPTWASGNGSVTYTPWAAAMYTLTCSSGGKDGSPSDTEQVLVGLAENAAAPSCTLSASSSGYVSLYAPKFFVKPNSDVTLSWTSENATYAAVMGGDKGDPSGSITLDNLTNVENDYFVEVVGPGGSARCDITVYVDWKG